MRVLNELRDPWAIAFAQAAAVLTYFLFAAPAWQSALAALAVLGVRAVAGVTMPLSAPTIPPPSLLSEAELAVSRYVAMGRTDDEIAQRTQSNEKIARKRRQTVMTKLGFAHEWELREWALAHRLIPSRPRATGTSEQSCGERWPEADSSAFSGRPTRSRRRSGLGSSPN